MLRSLPNSTLFPYTTLFRSRKLYFINVSKGIEPATLKRVSEIVDDEIDEQLLGAYAVLTGPSHAEEVIERKLTVLTAASNVEWRSEEHTSELQSRENLVCRL